MWMLGGTLAAGGVAIFVIGRLGRIGRLPRNRWVGIRTSWARASDRTWLVAHHAAGKVLMASGLVVVALAATLIVVGDESNVWANLVALTSCAVMLVGGALGARLARAAVRDDVHDAATS